LDSTQKMHNEEYDSSGYVLANETLSIHSKELTFFRRTLRLFGFWHPPEAGFIERIIYPFLINLLLFSILVLEVYSIISHGTEHHTNMTAIFILGTLASISRYVWAWLCHTLEVKYFKDRNLERKLFDIEITPQIKNEISKMLRNLKWIVAASVAHTVITFSLSIVVLHPEQWAAANGRRHGHYNHTVKHLTDGTLYKFLTLLISTSNLYMVSILLCLTWLMYLLSKTSHIRLLQLKHDYMSWYQQAEQAIFHHYNFYSKQIQSNCKVISLLFISHNILMIIMTPQHIYLCLEVKRSKGATDLAIFLYFCLMFLIFWVIPLYFTESIKRQEDNFQAEINNFSLQNFERHCIVEKVNDECYVQGTFQSRTELNKLMSYLKHRKSGFLVGFYSFQLQLSMVSFYIGLLMLIIRLISG